jgi:hypothetical protein
MLGNANPRFFQRLLNEFEVIAAEALPRWAGRTDGLIVCRRRR